MMQLPGGLLIDEVLERGFLFKAVTGELELALSESAMLANSSPARVTRILSEALEMLAGEAVSEARIRALSVGDRQFLMRQLGVHIDDALTWFTATCGGCGESFDLSLRFSELPVKDAGAGFPETQIDMPQGRLSVRVPNGEDQESIAMIKDEREAMTMLFERLVSVDGACGAASDVSFSCFDEMQLTNVEMIVETMAPEVACEITTLCPQCHIENRVPVSPYACLERSGGDLYAEIHSLAANYHWSEQEILALPRRRRRIYLAMIDRKHGMNSAVAPVENGWH